MYSSQLPFPPHKTQQALLLHFNDAGVDYQLSSYAAFGGWAAAKPLSPSKLVIIARVFRVARASR